MPLSIGIDLNPHVFGTGNHTKKKLSGFHSKANYDSCALKPHICRMLPLGKYGFYLCGWNYFKRKETPLKWSTMFPDIWSEDDVLAAIKSAVAYWNNNSNAGKDKDRLTTLKDKLGLHWLGNADHLGRTYVLGGFRSQDKVVTAFPLAGHNANIPAFAGLDGLAVNTDVEVNEEDD